MSINVCNDRSMASITSLPSGVSGSSLVLLSEQTASSSATISFTSNIDSTYKEYQFHFIDIHPATDNTQFSFNMSVDSGSNYNVTKTTTAFETFHREDDGDAGLQYLTDSDLAQSTAFQRLSRESGADADQSISGLLTIFNPSSTTFVKHFISTMQSSQQEDASLSYGFAGYGNTTSSVNAIQFKMSSGNIDAGTIKLYGVKDS